MALRTLLATVAVSISLLALPAGAPAAALDGDGMWIWYVSRSSGGDPDRILAKAARHNVGMVVIKAADALDPWRQFSPELVNALKAGGLKVCAYQFVYGRYPRGEADLGAWAARQGADCLLIDAESHYEGRYWAAQTYLKRLRARVGPDYELGLTSFPYVHYHPAFPYSVFLGPGGAQENVPQMYWKAIGTSPERVFQVTYTHNRVYGRPIYPLGQTYGNPSSPQVLRFRKLASVYGAPGVSWWVWQFSGPRQWGAVGSPFAPVSVLRGDTMPLLRRGQRSDLVVWAQQHLVQLGLMDRVTGYFGSLTQDAVEELQLSRGLAVTRQVDAATWTELLPAGPAAVRWGRAGRAARPVTIAAGSRMPPPRNATAPAVRNELAGKPRG